VAFVTELGNKSVLIVMEQVRSSMETKIVLVRIATVKDTSLACTVVAGVRSLCNPFVLKGYVIKYTSQIKGNRNWEISDSGAVEKVI